MDGDDNLSVRIRGLFAGLALAGLAWSAGSPVLIASRDDVRSLTIYNIHNKETTQAVYKRGGRYDDAGLKRLNRAMRDWRTDEEATIDPRLFDILWEMHQELGSKEPIHLLSAYRSRQTNEKLRHSVGGQAKNSRHISGQAADVHFPDVPIKRLRYSAMVRERGGVGYYPTSAIPFIHVDTDRVRHWPPMPRYELALLFPNGQSKHMPSDGNPITREDVRIAQSRHQELAVQVAEFHDVRRMTGNGSRIAVASLTPPAISTQGAALAALDVPKPVPAQRPQLASLIPAPVPATNTRSALGASDLTQSTNIPAPPVAAISSRADRDAAAKQGPDLLGAFVRKVMAAFDRDAERSAPKPAVKAQQRVASVDPTAGVGYRAPTLTDGGSRGWPTGWAHAPAFDEEHPEELSYRPFAIGPVMTADESGAGSALTAMQAPQSGRAFELLDESERLFPLSFRPGKQVAELMWARQFSGARVGADTLLSRLKEASSDTDIATRKVSTTRQ
jgi:uncharacterized protein YcbK (DUF882 family)